MQQTEGLRCSNWAEHVCESREDSFGGSTILVAERFEKSVPHARARTGGVPENRTQIALVEAYALVPTMKQ